MKEKKYSPGGRKNRPAEVFLSFGLLFRAGLTGLVLFLQAGLFLDVAYGIPEDVRLLTSDREGLTLELTVPEFEIEPVTCPDGESCDRIHVSGWARSLQAGSPELPVIGVLVEVPDEGAVTVQVLEAEPEIFPDTLSVCPVPQIRILKSSADGDRQRNNREKAAVETLTWDEAAYSADTWVPATLAEAGSRKVLRGTTLVRLLLCPFQWNPSSGELRTFQRLVVRVEFESPLLPAAGNLSQKENRRAFFSASAPADDVPFGKLLQAMVVNRQENNQEITEAGTLTLAVEADSPAPECRLKILIERTGLYRLTYGELEAAGMQLTNIAPGSLRVFHQGTELAVSVVTAQSDLFAGGDFIEFYAQAIDTLYTGTNVYWLYVDGGQGEGKRAGLADGAVVGAPETLTSFMDTLQVEQNLVKWPGEIPGGSAETDHWYWTRLSDFSEAHYTLEVPSPVTAGAVAPVLRVCFQGRTTAGHHTRLLLNGTPIADDFWDGAVKYVQQAEVPEGLLASGLNTVTVSLPGDAGIEEVYLNRIELTYERHLSYEGSGPLAFTLPPGEMAATDIRNLPGSEVLLYDVTDPGEAKKMAGFSLVAVEDEPLYTLTFRHEGDTEKSYVAAAVGDLLKPAHLQVSREEDLTSPSIQADYVLITPREFLPAAWPLILFRYIQGHNVMPASTEAVYDEFSYGIEDPAAIKNFLGHAYRNWRSPAPAYVCLAGDANADYRDYYGTGKKNQVPTHLSYQDLAGILPDDNWFACVDGEDELPDMQIGRIPGSNPASVAKVIWKILRYELFSVPSHRNALFIADTGYFEYVTDALIDDYLPLDFSAVTVYRDSYADDPAARQDIIDLLNGGLATDPPLEEEGMMITSYVGHGATTRWGTALLESSHVPLLTNRDRLSFMMGLTCLSCYFAHWNYYSLCEELLAAPGGGAMASFSSSGAGYTWEHNKLAQQIFLQIFENDERAVGSIVTPAKIAAYSDGASMDMVRSFTLIGDPATRLKGWEQENAAD